MASPTISLALIAKNEEKNIDRLLDSVEGCFEEIILVDTGSTDKTKEIAEKRGCKVYDFKWVNSFCKARNFAFSKATMDYIAWLDLDDCLSSKDAFIQWKTHAMEFSDIWYATYHYALDKDKKPIVSFVRERVFKRSLNPTWQFDLHEGIVIKPEWRGDYAIPWAVLHMRDETDIIADKSRNIKILEELKEKGELPTRLKFYYGKELYENQSPSKAIGAFEEALKCSDLEHHDKLLSYQYAAYSAFQSAQQLKDEYREEKLKLLDQALGFAINGIKLDPSRAEYYCTAGDVHVYKGEFHKAISFYGAAQKCVNPKEMMGAYEGAVYSFIDTYGPIPTLQLAKCFFQMGRLEDAKKEAQYAIDKYSNKEAEEILTEIKRIEELTRLDNNQEQTQDIVITTPPQTAYPFDEEIYKTKGLGGSETALVQMAKYLKEITGRPVKVFNMRENDYLSESGVEYISNRKVNEYMSKNLPYVHIAWRHNVRLTRAKTYLWCHDLTTPTVESIQNFDKIICLSEFHKNYVMAKQNVPIEKIWVSRNGIPVEKLKFQLQPKNPNKVVWMSSPDRGLDRCMEIMDLLIKENQHLELHVYYGLENLYKYGLGNLAEKLKAMMSERPWVKYHGFTEQSKMYQDVSDAVIWLHPCNFIETFCITALEMLKLSVFPITRRLGALANTLSDAEKLGHAILLDHNGETDEQKKEYVDAFKKVMNNNLWSNIYLDDSKYSWKSVAEEWTKEMQL